MLFYFNVCIKTNNLKKVKMEERLVEWGGELFSREPPQYEYNGTLIFDEFINNNYLKKYYSRIIDGDFDLDKYRTFRLLGEDLLEIEKLVNANNAEIENHELYKFLTNLFSIDDFIIFLIRDEEEIDEKYKVTTKEELLDVFCNCFKWDSPKGALITKLS